MKSLYVLPFFVTLCYSGVEISGPTALFTEENAADKKPVQVLYTMPEEGMPHEGTWLQWPHQYQYGEAYRDRLDDAWIEMTHALSDGEKVHLIVYDEEEEERVREMLAEDKISLKNIDFKIYKTDDVWVRDNGPIYAKDNKGNLVIEDWGFNGWGKKAEFENCDEIPERIANDQHKKYLDLNEVMINEGGAVEIDGNGTMMATKSAILNKNRNPGMSQAKAQEIFTRYYGVTNFIWLEGKAGLEITDMHIDGFARFGDKNTIVTMSPDDLLEWQVPQNDINKLYQSTNKNKKKYNFVKLPLTSENVTTAYGKKLDYPGSYVNYYIANNVVLVPNYKDRNDAVANAIIQKLYPNREVVGIDVRNLYANGGMIHCVTQQQPR